MPEDRIYVDHGLTGTNRERPGLREALAACRAGDILVVTKLDRLARSLPDARDIIEDLTKKKVKLSIGGNVHDLIRARTHEGMQAAKAKGRLRGKQPKLSKSQEAHLVSLYKGGQHTTTEIAELFKVAEPIRQLMRDGRLEQAFELCYAAIVHRKLGQRDEKIAVLSRWLESCSAEYRDGSRIAMRLAKLAR